MKQFFIGLMSDGNEASSKRFAAIFTLFNVILLAWVSTVNSNGIVPEFIFDGLLLLSGGGLGLTVIEKIFNKNKTN